jgi:predicted AAA+ superfamily ATPase
MYITRDIEPHLIRCAEQFPALVIMGPRQSGKTTLARHTFPKHQYVSLEDLDKRVLAQEDPRGFLAAYHRSTGVIIDEIQHVPELLSYMQGIIDAAYMPGFFIVTGSQHFLIYEKVAQTLAGRIALITLLPLSIHECISAQLEAKSPEELMVKSGYPRVYAQHIDPALWITNYISTYIERDVRQVLAIKNIGTFQRFIMLCAARVGTMLNYADLARDADISPNTAKEWVSLLEARFILVLLKPYHTNFNKRIVKSPKLYFYDPAIACSLLGIKTAEELLISPFRGALFESLIISECFKYSYNRNAHPQLYFWRDSNGHEIDCIIEKRYLETVPLEIKASRTASSDFFKGVALWSALTQKDTSSYVIYGGNETIATRAGTLYQWKDIDTLLSKIYGPDTPH